LGELALGIETSHELGGIALVRGDECIAEVRSKAKLKHSEELIFLIDSVMKAAGSALEDVSLVAVSIGPGSFTGLRVGLATAKGLCFSRGVPLMDVPTLDALASMVRCERMPVYTIIDAKRGELYWARYEAEDGVQRRTAGYGALTPGSLIEQITSEALVVGSGLDRYRDFILENARAPINLIEPNPRFPSPAAVSKLGVERIRSGITVDIDSVEPIYIRPSDAEAGRRNT
jgi:tRNA threonylcarbamoyladenosine biosynthesis protein TsaB